VGSIMGQENEVKQESGGSRAWNAIMVGLVLIGLCAAVLSIAKPKLAKPEGMKQAWQEVVGIAPAVETEQVARDIGPAPTLRKGKPTKKDGKLMPNWVATGAGATEYNGLYSQVGGETYNGEPVYRLAGSPTGKALFKAFLSSCWWLSADVQEPPPSEAQAAYESPSGTLPGNPWAANLGTAPAPTLAEQTPTPPDWPWNWFDDGHYYGPGDRIRPCRATIAGTNYILFPWQNGTDMAVAFAEIVTADPLDITFTRKTWTTTPVFYDETPGVTTHDPGQTAAAYDAGDGSHIYICSGSYLDGSSNPYFDFAMWDVTPATPTKGTVDTVALPSVHITPFLQVAADTFRFMCVDGTDGKYYEYVALSGALTLLGTAALPALPSGYADVACSADAIGRLDISLYERDGTVLFGRHVVNGTTHRIVENSVAVA
jgi:hypothetical protein